VEYHKKRISEKEFEKRVLEYHTQLDGSTAQLKIPKEEEVAKR
jgi:hypothetical protein